MRDKPRGEEDHLVEGLEKWANSVSFPPTPNIAAAVTARLSHGTVAGSWRPHLRRHQVGYALMMVAVLSIVVAGIGIGSTLESPSKHSLSAESVLRRAARVQPSENQLIRLSFRVSMRGAGGGRVGTVNVWEAEIGGTYTVLEVQPGTRIGAARFVEQNGSVIRSWAAGGASRDLLLKTLAGTPLAGQDARLLAARILEGKRGSAWNVLVAGRATVGGKHALVIRLTPPPPAGGAITLSFDAGNYRLLRIATGGYVAQLVSTHVVSRGNVPQLVTAYINSPTKPEPASNGVATY